MPNGHTKTDGCSNRDAETNGHTCTNISSFPDSDAFPNGDTGTEANYRSLQFS